jgi:N6-adenosine-specific RNA methylase IME4
MRARCHQCGKTFETQRSDAATCSTKCRVARHLRLQATTPPWPNGKFDLIYADPPWHVRAYAEPEKTAGFRGGRRLPYDYMDLPAICRLPIAQFAAQNSVLAIWVNSAEVEATLKVIKAWGFSNTSEGLYWGKLSSKAKLRMGLGHRTRKTGENLWLATRGKGLKRADMGVEQGFIEEPDADFIVAKRREHSRKPDEAYQALERLYGDVRRIELFGRRARPGWTLWGNQLLPPDAQQMLPFDGAEMFEELRMPSR